MHLLESYAASTGVKISKPFIFEKFFPLSIDGYVTLHPYSKPAKTYEYFQEVVDIIEPVLKRNRIAIVQIGHGSERPLRKVIPIMGQTSVNQIAYLLRNSLMHIGVDSFPVHIASSYSKPIVALYGNNYVSCVRPFFGEQGNYSLIEPDRTKKKPCLSLDEIPRQINSIKPEIVADEIFKKLGFSDRSNRNSLYFGPLYNLLMLEVVPNGIYYPHFYQVESFIVRMDILHDENCLREQLKQCPCVIVTDRPISLEVLTSNRKNVREIVYLITEKNEPNFAAALLANGIRFQLLTDLPAEKFDKFKIDYLEISGVAFRPAQMPPELEGKDFSKIWYKTHKFILSGNTLFPSKAAYEARVPIASLDQNYARLSTIKDLSKLWHEAHHFHFFEETVDAA